MSRSHAARQRELVVAPVQIVEPTRLEKRHDLERLRAGPPVREPARFTRAGNKAIARVDDRRVNAVLRLDDSPSRRDDVELQRPHSSLAVASTYRMGLTLET